MRGKKWVLMLTLTFLLGALIPSVPPVKATSPVRFYVRPVSPGHVPGEVPDNTVNVFVDIYIDSPPEWYGDNVNGIVGWAMSVKVDPDMLAVWALTGSQAGYFLNDFAYNEFGEITNLLFTKDTPNGLFYEISEFVKGWDLDPINGTGAGGSGKLVTLEFKSLNETGYSLIDLGFPTEDYPTAYYYTSVGRFPADVIIDGHYNAPPDLLGIHSTSSLIDLTNPETTSWEELYPTGEGATFSLNTWSDLNTDSKLSPGDAIKLDSTWYQVEKVTVTIHDVKGGNDRYFELLDGHVGYDAAITTDPTGTLWHEWYEFLSALLNLTSWTDDEPSGNLTVGDDVVLTYIDPGPVPRTNPGDTLSITLDEVSTDILVSGPIAAPPEFPLGLALEIGLIAAIAYVWWRSRRKTKITKQPKLASRHHQQASNHNLM